MAINREEILELCKSDPESIVALIEKMDARIMQLEARITELESRIKQNSRNSSRPPSTDVFIKPKSQRKKGERPVGGQKGHKGHTLELVDNPDETIVHIVEVCKECGASLEDVRVTGIERRQVHELPPIKIIVTEHRAEHKQCPHCRYHNKAEFPEDVQYSVQYGRYLKSVMVYLGVYQLIPYDRISELFSDLCGHSISKGTLAKALETCYDDLEGVEEKIRTLLVGSQVLNVDETGFRVTGDRHWLHVASTELLTLYGHHKKRGVIATDALQILPDFKGTMVHDFWKPYFRYTCSHALCNAHLLRELTGISETFGQIWSTQMNELIHDIKAAGDKTSLQFRSLGQDQIADFEARYSRIIALGFEENPVIVCVRPFGSRGRKKQSKSKNLLDRCQNHRTEILAFMYDPTVPFDNNQAERDIRMMKVQQKISGTFRSEEGADWFCRIRGYISTVKKNAQPVLASLVGAMNDSPFIPSAPHRLG
jgi:transposase